MLSGCLEKTTHTICLSSYFCSFMKINTFDNMNLHILCAFIIGHVLNFSFPQHILRIDCHPGRNASEATCTRSECLWLPTTQQRVPWCIFQPWQANNTYFGYDLTTFKYNRTGQRLNGVLKRRPTPSLFGKDYNEFSIKIVQLSDSIFHAVIHDKESKAHRIKLEHDFDFKRHQRQPDVGQLDMFFQKVPFGFGFRRKTSNRTIFDTTYLPGFSMAEQYVQISIKVPSQYVYGIGETSYSQLKHDFNWRQWGLFARDHIPNDDNSNLYGVHPFYLCMEENNTHNTHGVFFLNSHAINVALQPDPDIITFRAIGGSVEFFIFAGPTPDLVLAQYTSIIGRPNMPPYWALGFQLSRYGYKNVTYLREVFDRNRKMHIPQDVQFVDLDYADRRLDFTVDPKNFANFSFFVDELHLKHMKLVLIVDPAISSRPPIAQYNPLTIGLKWDVFIKDNRTGQPLEGRVWPGRTYFPDFSKHITSNYWLKMLHDFQHIVRYDGIWIDMNEPSNFVDGSMTSCSNNSFNYPPYNPLIYDPIFDHTICMDADQERKKHYALHNLYGYHEAQATYKAMKKLSFSRPFILSRSTFAGSGRFTNHWTGDNRSQWAHMKYSVITILLFQMFGIPMTGADICGFNGEVSEELCIRWMQLGAFYPYSRNHNSDDVHKDQDPAAWPTDAVNIMRDALIKRYALLPYVYTLFYKAHKHGRAVWRPLFFDFPTDLTAREIDDQFLIGPALMVAPILEPNTTQRLVYFPNATWFRFMSVNHRKFVSGYFKMDLQKDIGLFMKSGTTIPIQLPAETTFESRLNPFWLYVALTTSGESYGELYLDDGECVVENEACRKAYTKFFTAYQNPTQSIKIVRSGTYTFENNQNLEKIIVFGLQSNVTEVAVDGFRLNPNKITLNFECFTQTELFCWMEVQVDISMNNGHIITWNI